MTRGPRDARYVDMTKTGNVKERAMNAVGFQTDGFEKDELLGSEVPKIHGQFRDRFVRVKVVGLFLLSASSLSPTFPKDVNSSLRRSNNE